MPRRRRTGIRLHYDGYLQPGSNNSSPGTWARVRLSMTLSVLERTAKDFVSLDTRIIFPPGLGHNYFDNYRTLSRTGYYEINRI